MRYCFRYRRFLLIRFQKRIDPATTVLEVLARELSWPEVLLPGPRLQPARWLHLERIQSGQEAPPRAANEVLREQLEHSGAEFHFVQLYGDRVTLEESSLLAAYDQRGCFLFRADRPAPSCPPWQWNLRGVDPGAALT